MPSARISRGLVSLAASAITAVYAAGYLHTQSADSAFGDFGTTTPVATQVADSKTADALASPVAVAVIGQATSRATPGVITDQAVELYADQHHISWDAARAQMKADGWIEQQVPPTASPTATVLSVARSAPESAASINRVTSTATPVARPTAAPVARSAPVAPTATPAKAVASGFKDGTYTGLGTSRRGNVQVSLVVQAGRIATVTITGATTQYPTRLIAGLPAQVVSHQSAQVNSVSGATYSSLAFRAAVQQALQSAQA